MLPREISLSILCSHSSCCSAFYLASPLRVGHLRASVLRSDWMGLKEQLIQVLWLTQARGREGYEMQVEPAAAEACHVFSQGSCPWIMGPWQCGLHRLPEGGVWIETCACTQAS